jgi:hypothetical protein
MDMHRWMAGNLLTRKKSLLSAKESSPKAGTRTQHNRAGAYFRETLKRNIR